MSNTEAQEKVGESHIAYDKFDTYLLSTSATEEDIIDVCKLVIQRYGRKPA